MNELQVFESAQFGQVRTVQKDGEPWFVAADVCRALEIANNRNAISRLDDDEKRGCCRNEKFCSSPLFRFRE